MKHSFEVGNTAYIVEFRSKCEFIFYIDVLNSKYEPGKKCSVNLIPYFGFNCLDS